MTVAARGSTLLTCSWSWPYTGALFTVRRSLRCPLSTVRSMHRSPLQRSQNNPIKHWNDFYKRHHNKFFKDRHYLEKDWGGYFSDDHTASPTGKVVLEVGCGAGNTIFPLMAAYSSLYIHACDFSPHAIGLVKSHIDYREERINAFVCDATVKNFCNMITPASIDVVTLFPQRRCP